MRILPNIFICHFLISIACGYVIERGPTESILNWTVTNDKYVVDLRENNHVDGADHLLLFTIKEVSAEPKFRPGPASFLFELVQTDATSYEFYIDQFMDYETETSHTYYLTSVVDVTDVLTMTINIINYDDENPTLTAPMCSMEENTNYSTINTECKATLSDPDGWLGQTTFTIVNSNPSATDQLDKEDEIFQFEFDKTISDTVYNTTVYLTTTMQLDYETKIFYSFVVQAKDGAQHPTIPKEDVTCIVNVIDLNDMPPQWTDYFTTKEITEKTAYTYTMTAVDGDKGINADINYHLISYDKGICKDACVTITKENKKAIIQVNPIDRDAKDISTYKFDVMAIEDDIPPYNTTITITFFVNDIDDNSPLMMNVMYNDTVTDLADEDTKIMEYTFYENFAGTINGYIFIQDIDTGENAQFTVALNEDESHERKAIYTDAFLIVPTAGYRKGEFQITVRNATYLDFEDEIWREFAFYVQSTGNKDPKKQDKLLVQINLVDYNDEWPIFKENSYSVSVKETIKKGTLIIVVQATDRDAEDKILKHQLVGSNAITSLLNIDSAKGEISVAVVDAFDYDRINPIIFQVQAIDAVNHTTTVPVTINLIDVNNKAPTYKVAEVIRVDENQVIDIVLNATITASDVDTTRDLVAEINWAKSYAMKNSIKLDLTKSQYKQAVEFLKLDYDKISDDTIQIILSVNDNNDAQTAPDFETFDTLYLDLKITDLNTEVPEFEKQKSIDALIVVYINDINDNAPIFTNETIAKKRSVFEKLAKGTIVGNIEAIDLDVGSVVEYSCVNLNKTLDWLDCDIYGQITTKTSAIDADIPVNKVAINCTATDGYWKTWHVFDIDILDTNDKWPQIDVNGTSPSADTVKVDEKSETGTFVTTLGYRDADRDEPFHTVYCSINDTEECYGLFEIKVDKLYVLDGGKNLDRDEGKPNFTCTPTCRDNPSKEQDLRQNFNTTTSFLIILLDINDHWPQLKTTSVSGSEDLQKDELIDKILAEDLDEGVNSEIDMMIMSVEKLDDNTEKDYKNLFRLYKNESDYYTDISTIKQWYLMANVDLRDNYGQYSIQLKLSDRGDPINSNLTFLQVEIRKFNYYPPVFVFPNASRNTFSLSSDQEPYKPLAMYYNNDKFDDIKIFDSADEKCIDKWTPTFDVTLIDESQSLTNFFTIQSPATCTTQLQVNNLYNKAEAIAVTYQLRLTATLAQDVTKLENEASYVESIDIKLNFVDVNDEPEFNKTLGAWEIKFKEATDDDPNKLPLQYQAFYPHVADSDRIPKYYFLKSDDINVTEAFEVDLATGTVSLKRQLDYLVATGYDFQMRVARNSSGVSSKDASNLDVKVTVIDINNHAPEFTQPSFFGAVLQNTQKGSTIVTINATDLDEIDKDDLHYSLNSTIVSYGNNIVDAFLLDGITGAITLNFQVDYNINGYFVFSVKVEDQQDQYGNGPFEDIAIVTIYIVTEDYILGFKFENTLDTVVSKKVPILKTISDSLGWECHDQIIDNDSQSGYTYDNVTKANVYCVDVDSLVTSATMKDKLNNINTFQMLKNALLELGILLQNFNTDTTTEGNLESSLKTALISVSVVLGTLSLVLSVTFFLKARELKRRLTKLTHQEFGSDDSNMNRKGVHAPTTNMFTIEGSNPVFNHDIDDFVKADISSIHSDHSDLSGLEDNPEFDLDETKKY